MYHLSTYADEYDCSFLLWIEISKIHHSCANSVNASGYFFLFHLDLYLLYFDPTNFALIQYWYFHSRLNGLWPSRSYTEEEHRNANRARAIVSNRIDNIVRITQQNTLTAVPTLPCRSAGVNSLIARCNIASMLRLATFWAICGGPYLESQWTSICSF